LPFHRAQPQVADDGKIGNLTLTSQADHSYLPPMKSILRWLTVLGLAVSLSSCGLPGAAVRSVSNTVKGISNAAQGLGGMAGAASML
jgi:purine-cytosine permease-like protein